MAWIRQDSKRGGESPSATANNNEQGFRSRGSFQKLAPFIRDEECLVEFSKFYIKISCRKVNFYYLPDL